MGATQLSYQGVSSQDSWAPTVHHDMLLVTWGTERNKGHGAYSRGRVAGHAGGE